MVQKTFIVIQFIIYPVNMSIMVQLTGPKSILEFTMQGDIDLEVGFDGFSVKLEKKTI